MVARISWWPETSSRVTGRYFSTLRDHQRNVTTPDGCLKKLEESFAYQGRLSSASTGRLAALRLPLLVSAEKVMSLEGAESTSISSSKSDIVMIERESVDLEKVVSLSIRGISAIYWCVETVVLSSAKCGLRSYRCRMKVDRVKCLTRSPRFVHGPTPTSPLFSSASNHDSNQLFRK